MMRKRNGLITRYVAGTMALMLLMAAEELNAQKSNVPFFPEGSYAPGIPAPENVLGFSIGEKPVRYNEAVRYSTNVLASKFQRKNFISSRV